MIHSGIDDELVMWSYFTKRLDYLMLGSVYGLSWSLGQTGVYIIYIGYWSVFRCDWFLLDCDQMCGYLTFDFNMWYHNGFRLLEARVPGCINWLYHLSMDELLVLTYE